MKKIQIGLFLFLIMFFPTIVGATNLTANKHSGNLVSDCVIDGTCMKLCEYENYYQISKMNEDLYYSSMYIYYDFKEGIVVEWYGPSSKQGEKKYTKKGFDDIFIQKDVKSSFIDEGVCPAYAYIDSDEFNGPNEACLDNDGKYCKSDPGKSFTNFKGTSTQKFNFAVSVYKYFNEYAPSITCEQLLSSNFDFSETMLLDFKTNYLHGNTIPSILLNSKAFIEGKEALGKKYTAIKNDCSEEIKEQQEQGKISSNEAEKNLENLDNGLQNALNGIEKFEEELQKDEIGELQQGDIVTGCEVIPEVVRKWINNILNFVKYVALALVIALGALDFMKAAASGEPDGMKKAGQSFIKRLIAVVVLFLLPVIVDFILNMVNIYGVDTNNIDCL